MKKIIINSLLGLILIFLWSRFVDLTEIFSILSKVKIWMILPILLFFLLSQIIRAIRLKIFLSPNLKVGLKELTFLNIAAQMLNFYIPIRAGEIAKGVYLHDRYNLQLGRALIWVFLDRFVDFLVVLLLSAGLLLIVPTSLSINFNTQYQASLIIVITVIFLIALILTYLAIFQLNFSKKIINFLKPLFIIKSIKIHFERFSHFILDSFSILRRHPKDLFLMILTTVLAYFTDAAVYYFTFLAVGLNENMLRMYLGQLLSALTYLIPAAPGYIGSAEVSGLVVFSGILGIDANLASAMVVLLHINQATFVLIFGLISIFNLKLDLGRTLRKALRKE